MFMLCCAKTARQPPRRRRAARGGAALARSGYWGPFARCTGAVHAPLDPAPGPLVPPVHIQSGSVRSVRSVRRSGSLYSKYSMAATFPAMDRRAGTAHVYVMSTVRNCTTLTDILLCQRVLYRRRQSPPQLSAASPGIPPPPSRLCSSPLAAVNLRHPV